MAVVCVAMVASFTGDVLMEQPGTGIITAAVLNTVVFVAAQLVAGPLAFLGAIYQLYCVEGVRPVTLYDGTDTLALGEAGGVRPVQI